MTMSIHDKIKRTLEREAQVLEDRPPKPPTAEPSSSGTPTGLSSLERKQPAEGRDTVRRQSVSLTEALLAREGRRRDAPRYRKCPMLTRR